MQYATRSLGRGFHFTIFVIILVQTVSMKQQILITPVPIIFIPFRVWKDGDKLIDTTHCQTNPIHRNAKICDTILTSTNLASRTGKLSDGYNNKKLPHLVKRFQFFLKFLIFLNSEIGEHLA